MIPVASIPSPIGIEHDIRATLALTAPRAGLDLNKRPNDRDVSNQRVAGGDTLTTGASRDSGICLHLGWTLTLATDAFSQRRTKQQANYVLDTVVNHLAIGQAEHLDPARTDLSIFWAHSANSWQRLSCGLWHHGHWYSGAPIKLVKWIQADRSSVNSLQCRDRSDRAIVSEGSLAVAANHWGRVVGRAQTHPQSDSWKRQYDGARLSAIWIHQVRRRDGRPSREAETSLTKSLSVQ